MTSSSTSAREEHQGRRRLPQLPAAVVDLKHERLHPHHPGEHPFRFPAKSASFTLCTVASMTDHAYFRHGRVRPCSVVSVPAPTLLTLLTPSSPWTLTHHSHHPFPASRTRCTNSPEPELLAARIKQRPAVDLLLHRVSEPEDCTFAVKIQLTELSFFHIKRKPAPITNVLVAQWLAVLFLHPAGPCSNPHSHTFSCFLLFYYFCYMFKFITFNW